MKKIIMLFPIIFIISIVTSCSDYMNDIADDTKEINLNDGLVAYWPIRETIVTGDDSGEIMDVTRNIEMTLYYGGGIGGPEPVAFTIPGKFGNALRFNNLWNYANISHSNFLSGSNKFSVAFWIRNPYGNVPIIISKGFSIRSTSTTDLVFKIIPSNDSVECTGTWISADTWAHVTCTYDKNSICLYINGKLVSKKNSTQNIDIIEQITLCSEMEHGEGDPCLDADLDEIRIYNRALNEDEIKLLMKTGIN